MGWYSFWHYRRKKQARSDGIRAHTKRGNFGASVLARQWVALLEQASDAERLTHGKSYARRGMVETLTIKPGVVRATVNGSYGKYTVKIELPVYTDNVWHDFFAVLNNNLVYTACVLTGTDPDTLERIFSIMHEPLLPDNKELRCSCTCHDWVPVCKHVAAVAYLIAEEIDRQPIIVCTLRGKSYKELVKTLKKQVIEQIRAKKPRRTSVKHIEEQAKAIDTITQETFWHYHMPIIKFPSTRTEPSYIEKLGPLPWWRATEPCVPTMKKIYQSAQEHAATLLEDLEEESIS